MCIRDRNQIINWLILTIIFVFDPLAVTLVVAFNNALQVDRGIVDKKKIIRKRELYDEKPEKEEPLPDEARGFKSKMSKKEENESLIKMGEPLVTAAENNVPLVGQPYYLHPSFDWRIKKLWQNDTEAVRYWMKNIKEKQYPNDFTKKTY